MRRLLLIGIVPLLLGAATTSGTEEESLADAARRTVRSTVEWLARGVDGWFGDRPFEEGGKVTEGRLSLAVLKRQDESADFSARFNARFRLPNIERIGYLFIGRDNRREIVADTPGAFSRQERLLPERVEDQSFFAGVGVSVLDAVDLRLGVRRGIKPYAQARLRHQWQFGARDLVEVRETVFWTHDDRFGSTTAVSYEHAFSSTLAMRWLNAATITQESDKFDWSTGLGAYRSFGQQRLLSLEVLANGRRGGAVALSDYGVQARWQQPVYRDWLLGELVVGHFRPRADAAVARDRVWALGSGLKLRF